MGNPEFPLSSIAIIVPLLACIAIIIDIPPILLHAKNRNFAAAGLVFWVILGLLFDFINALIWPTDDIANWFRGYILCDIEAKLLVALSVGLPGSLACIMKNLASVLDTNNTVLMPTRLQRKKQLAVEIFLTFGFPICLMGIHYIVQPKRYYILGIAGCMPAFDDSWPTVVLIWIWPSLLSILAVYYSVLVIIRLHKYRQEFSSIINSSNSNLTKSRFKRLFVMSSLLILICLPVQLYVLHQNSSYPLYPYHWNTVHGSGWSEIIMIPSGGAVYYDHWIHIAVGFTVFIFFGLGKDAIKMYRNWLLKAGLGTIIPSLHHSSIVGSPSAASAGEGSFGSRARLFLAKRLSGSSSSRISSVSTTLTSPSPRDPQKAFPPLSTIVEAEPSASSERSFASTNEKAAIPAPRLQTRMPYLLSFISAFRSPAASRQMAASAGNAV